MQCRDCGASVDADAVYCVQCGKPIDGNEEKSAGRKRKIVLGVLLLVIVMAVAAAVGYYKFILPDGVAAVVNGEVIRLSELNAEFSRTGGALEENAARSEDDAAARGGMRYQVLNRMITDRLALQEARKAGLEVSAGELSTALAYIQSASRYEKKKFSELVSARYGSLREFEQRLSQDLLIRKFITERIVPPGADPGAARAAVDRWLQDLSRTAAVRIALAEQWSAAGCSCCSGAAKPSGSRGTAVVSPKGDQSAADAALGYWHERYGGGPYATRVKDFGCHIQIDILRENTVVGSLRYQDGVISENP